MNVLSSNRRIINVLDDDDDGDKNRCAEVMMRCVSCVKESAVGTCKSSTEAVPLRAKPPINFQDAVFYYPADQTADEDRRRRGPAHVLSEGQVPAVSATAYCSSDDKLPLKEVLSMQPGVGDDMPLIAGSRHQTSMLRRMRAFFARSSNSCTGTGQDDMARAGRQLSAADA